MRGDRRGTKQQEETEGMAASPFASLSMSGGGDSAAAAAAPCSSSSSSPAPAPPSSALKLSVSGRLSRSFSKLGLSRISSSSVGAGLSRRTLLDEGKSSSSKSLPASRAASSAIPTEVVVEEEASPPPPPSRRLLLSSGKKQKGATKTPAFGLSPSPSPEKGLAASKEEEDAKKVKKEAEEEDEKANDDDDNSTAAEEEDPPLEDCLAAAAAHARSPRRGLPPLAAPPPRVGSLLFLAREAVRAPDLAQAPVPIAMNEPLSELQQRAEDLEYSELLDQAALKPKASRERLLLVTAFAVSAYCGVHRTGKPFASLLGETFELVSARKGFRFLAEKVRHAPTAINRAHARGRHGWTFDLEDELRVRLASSSPGGIDLMPAVLVRVRFDDGDAYRWGKAVTTVHGVLAGRMWLQHRGRWSVSSEATGERVELEFGCFGGAASGEFAAALADEAAEAARLLRESSEGGGGGGGGGEEPNEPPTPSSFSSSCAEAFETVGFAPGAALSDRDRAVAAKRRALREVRGRLMTSPAGSHQSGSGSSCSGCCRDKKGGGSGSCSGSHATGITLAGAWDSGLVIIDESAAVEGSESGAPSSSTSSSSPTAASASSAPQQKRRRRRSIIWTAAVDATSPVARGDNRYCMSRWTLALNEEDGAAEAAATRAAAVVVGASPSTAATTPRFGTTSTSSSSSSALPPPPPPAHQHHHHDPLSLSLACHSRSSVAFRAPPATDSRRRPDLRAVEHGDWEAAAAARDALLAAQARRAAAEAAAEGPGGRGGGHEPAWFRVRDPGATAGESFMFEYAGGYWADRKRRAAEEERERRAAAAAAARGGNDDDDDDDDHLFFDAQEAPF